jgi:hypothetical protein
VLRTTKEEKARKPGLMMIKLGCNLFAISTTSFRSMYQYQELMLKNGIGSLTAFIHLPNFPCAPLK